MRNTGNAGIGLDVSFDPLCKDRACRRAPISSASTCSTRYFGARELGEPAVHRDRPPTARRHRLRACRQHECDRDSDCERTGHERRRSGTRSTTTLARTLCPNDTGKFEASIYVQSIETGTYAGELFLQGRLNPVCPTDHGSVYNAAPTIPATGYWS